MAEQLWLFDPASLKDDSLHLAMQKLKLASAVKAENTRKAYEWSWGKFVEWCRARNVSALPASEETVQLYVTWLFTEKQARAESVRRYVSSIASAHTGMRLPNPITAAVRALIRGAKRALRDHSIGKKALTRDDVMAACQVLARQRKDNLAIRSRAILLFGFAGAMRRSEICDLQLSDLEINEDGLRVTIRQSKESEEPEVIGIRAGQRPVTCPVRAMQAWLRVRGERPGPLFLRLKSRNHRLAWKPMIGETINRTVKLAAESIGLDPKLYGAHSLRSGFVTGAHLNGASDLAIAERTRHKSVQSVKRYLRNPDPFAGRDPLRGML